MFKYFLIRELKESYIGNITGLAWVLIQPLITLFIYTIVFERIFKTRLPEAENIGFIVYLALGFWPWTAFSEGLIKSITSIVNQKNLIGKVQVDLRLAVFSTVSSSFIIHTIGYIIVLTLLIIIGKDFNYSAIPLLIIPMIQLYVFALSFGLILSALQVFIRDTLHFMSTIITLWFFSTPIIYSISLMPDYIKSVLKFNPVYTPITFIHNALITNKPLPWFDMSILSILLVVFFILANKLFKKLEPNFEDFI